MLKSDILVKLNQKYPNFNTSDIENLFELFIKKISTSLKEGNNIEIRGFGTLSRKSNKEKIVRNPRTNERLFKKETYKFQRLPLKYLSLLFLDQNILIHLRLF